VLRIPPPTLSKSDTHPQGKGMAKKKYKTNEKRNNKNPPKNFMHTMYNIHNNG